ncbi:MAG: 50S ribosomal protein L13 [Dehalococcoidia bacterium]|nr:50S ribosomal protein L13 [Dehalococcoidia bacterium]
MNNTYATRETDIKREWHIIDAAGKPLGRLCSQIASLLMGKHKTIYTPHLDTGDFVVVINAAKVLVTSPGRKGTAKAKKTYYHHSTYPGGLKAVSLREMLEKHPTRVIELCVKGMLPHNSLGRAMYRKLKVYAGEEHPYKAQIKATTSKNAKQMEVGK